VESRAPKGPIASIVGDLGSLDAVGIDHNVGRVAIAQCATLACSLGATFDAGSTVNRARWGRFCGWLDQKGPPTVRRCLNVVCHTIAGCLADTTEMLGPVAAPLMRVTGVAPAMLQDAIPDPSRNHGRITSSAKPHASIVKKVPIVTDRSIIAPFVTIPHAQWRLVPAHVAGPIIVTSMAAIAADAATHTILESLVRLYILKQNPRLQHATGLAIGRPFGQTRNNANDRSAVNRRETLPQDAAVHVGLNHHLLSAMESSDLPDERIIDHRQAGCQSLVKT
jgi:hypothetical protein